MHQGTSNCGTATAVNFARALGHCMMLLPPIHALQSPHALSAVSDHHQVHVTWGNKEVLSPSRKKG